NKEKAWAYAQDQLSTTHPVFTDASDIVTVDANFDGITYAKGASVLKQLAAYVGLEAFFAGARTHFAAHAWEHAAFDDSLSAPERSTGRDLSDWADQWLKTTGINTLKASFDVVDGAYRNFAVEQSGAAPGAGETRTHRIGIGIYRTDGDGQLSRITRVEADVAGPTTAITELDGTPAGGLGGPRNTYRPHRQQHPPHRRPRAAQPHHPRGRRRRWADHRYPGAGWIPGGRARHRQRRRPELRLHRAGRRLPEGGDREHHR